MVVPRKLHVWAVTMLTVILLMMLPFSVSAEEDTSQTTLSPSHVLLGAGARWAGRNGTTALYVNNRDNWAAHHLTDGADWEWLFSEKKRENVTSSVTAVLEQSGFEVTLVGDIPGNLGDYDLVVLDAYYAIEPRYSELMRNYVSDGGGVVLLQGAPCYFVYYSKILSTGTDLTSIQDWCGGGHYINAGGFASPAFDNPFGTSLLKSDIVGTHIYPICAAFSSLNADATAIAFWNSGSIFAYTNEYGSGRVYWQSTVSIEYKISDSTPSTDSSGVPTSISISTDVPSAFVGFGVDVSGVLSDTDGNALYNEPVALFYTFPSYESWVPVTSDTTNEFGEYDIRWIPPATGFFTLKAEWKGNATHLGSSDVLSLTTVPYENDRVLSVESNSTVSAFAFNSTSLELSFSVSGSDGTTGYVKLTVAKSIISDVAGVKVFLDGKELVYSASSSGDSWLLTFTYGHSSHQIRIGLAASTATMSFTGIMLWIAIGAAPIAIAVIGLLVYFKKRKR
jgi:hypothetical protein